MNALDENIIKEIRKDYLNKDIPITEIAKKWNISISSIYRYTKDLNRNSNKGKISEDIRKAVEDYYNTSIPVNEIAEKYNISKKAIYDHIDNERKRGHSNKGRKYSLNEKKLMIDSREKYYWLGFLAADGAVIRNSISIELKSTDKSHLEKFKKFLESEAPITSRINNKQCACNKIVINSVNIVNYIKKYNIIQNKSLSFVIPKKEIPDYYLLDFVRGLIDGDGCIRINNHQQINLSFCSGNQNCCQQVASILGITNKVSYSGNVWRFQVTGNIKAKKILDNLYKNSSYNTRLDRKYNIYKTLN